MKSLTVFIQTLETFRDFVSDREVPMQQLLAFAIVADRGEVPQADLIKELGLAQSSVSRTIAKLGPGENPRNPGWGLIEASEDPFFRKRKLVRITARGKELAREMEKSVARYLKPNVAHA